jgi:hypothetical protein
MSCWNKLSTEITYVERCRLIKTGLVEHSHSFAVMWLLDYPLVTSSAYFSLAGKVEAPSLTAGRAKTGLSHQRREALLVVVCDC